MQRVVFVLLDGLAERGVVAQVIPGEVELGVDMRGIDVASLDRMEARLKAGPAPDAGAADRDAFLEEWERIDAGSGHTRTVRLLGAAARRSGTQWLQAIADSAAALWDRV